MLYKYLPLLLYFFSLEVSLPQGTSEIFISLILEMLSVSNNINGFNANIILKVTDEAVTHVLICILDGFCCIGGGDFSL